MEKTWEVFLNQLSAPEPEFTYDDVSDWSPEDLDGLKRVGLISEIAGATHVACDACPEGHWERVRWSKDGKSAFIPCSATGIANVRLERLVRWRVDVGRLASLLAGALELSQKPEPVISLNPLWHLGRRRIGGRFQDFFLSVSGEHALAATIQEAQLQLSSGSGILIAPAKIPVDSEWEPCRLKTAVLSDITRWVDGKIVPDFDFIEDICVRGGTETRKSGIRDLSVPDGAEWKDLLIEVRDAELRIEVAGFKQDLPFDQAGFGDRDQKLETLKSLAAGRGRLASDHGTRVLRGKTPVKNRINALRKALQALIPIDGSPIEYNKRAGLYVCNFQTRLAGQESFPTPASSSWLDFRFVECRDGRLAVTVNERQVFRAHGVERVSSRRTEEVAQRDEAVTRLYSFEEVGLRNRRGTPTPEGTVMIELLRGDGKLKRRGDDVAVLKLAEWLRNWTGLAGEPLQYAGRNQGWSACFECAIEQKV